MGGLVVANAGDEGAVVASVLEGGLVKLVERLGVEGVLKVLEGESVLQ